MRTCALLLALLLALPPAAGAEAVAVRFTESSAHGFLILRGPGGEPIAEGEFIQTPKGDRVHTQLVFRFADGSLYDESLSFTQKKVFRLMSYKVVQKGKAFPESSEVSFERDGGGRYRARTGDDRADGKVDIPEDVHNGMTGLLLKNLPAGAGTSAHLLAFTPKPQVLTSTLRKEGEDRYFVGDTARSAARYLVKLDIPGVKGVLAGLIGKEPPDLRYWITTGEAPTFMRFEGPMYLKGPRWRVEVGAPRWSDAASRSAPRGSAPKS